MKKFMVFAAACAALVSFAAETVFDGNEAELWQSKRLSNVNGVIAGNVGYAVVKCKKMIPVTAGKKYVVSAEFRLIDPPAKAPRLFFGFFPCTADGQEISFLSVTPAAKNIIKVVKDVNVGDKSIVLEGMPAWTPGQYCRLAFNVKEDKSDLPNFDVSPIPDWKNMKKNSDGNIEVTMKAPFTKAYAAGTTVRLHLAGNSYVYAGYPRVSGEWVKISKEIKDFYPGTTQIKLAFNAEAANCKVEIRNITVTEE